MSCKITTAPINLPTGVNEKGGVNTDFTYNYAASSCSVTNKKTYLDINCYDGMNTVHSGLTGDLYVSSVRLYKPSLNTYDGRKADAELIITHSGGGKNLYICIPITSTTSSGGTVEWFRQFVPFSPSQSGSSKSVNVSSFTLNTIIPKAAYIVYEGGTFDWGCSKQDVMILFTLSNGINMSYRDLKTLGNIIKPASYNVLPVPTYLKFNSRGTTAGPGKKSSSKKSSTLTCTPIIDRDGNNIESPDQTTWVSTINKDSINLDKINKWWNVILGIILGIIVIGIVIYSLRKVRATASSSTITNTSSTGGS
tara:strand:+ start:1654 stop:2580 length:927 start_codon:yes stop_codon:yes gene_type:complete